MPNAGNRRIVGPVAAFMSLALAGVGSADVVNVGSAKDNTLYESATGHLSNGKGNHFFAGRTAQGVDSIRRGLIAFDLPSMVPPGSKVNSAQMTLHMSMTIVGAQNVSVHRLLADWGEGNSQAFGGEGTGDNAQPGDATWLHRFYDTVFWNTVGGDFEAAASATTSVAGNGFYNWGSTPAMVEDVQGWVDNPMGNFGWILVGNESAQPTAKRFDTRENPTPANRPQLEVDFTPPATLLDIEMVFGTLIGGDLSDLRFADGNEMELQSQFGFSATEPNIIEVEFAAQTAAASPSTIDLIFQGRLDNPGGVASARLRDWGTGQFVIVGTYPMGNVTSNEILTDVNASPYVRASDGRIDLRYRQSVVATFAATGFRAFYDVVAIRVNESSRGRGR